MESSPVRKQSVSMDGLSSSLDYNRKVRTQNLRGIQQALQEDKNLPNPVPIDKRDTITMQGMNGDMNLMQQYVMIKGKLQPALKYIAPNPMFNRYKVKNGGVEKFDEIMTYPTVTGDLNMKNKHQGVNYDDRDIPEKSMPKEQIEGPKKKDLEGVMKTI